jgi:hypothetical protein
MPIVDFHIHVHDFPVRAPRSFVEFHDRQIGSSFEKFVEAHDCAERYVAYLDESGIVLGMSAAPLVNSSRIGRSGRVSDDARDA